MNELLAHLITPLAKGGHGFETGVPATVGNAAKLHENDPPTDRLVARGHHA